MKLGYLDVKDYENWRRDKIPYLEKAIKLNLKKISLVMNSVKTNCEHGKLYASKTVYKTWGKRSKELLRFSKTGASNIEELYSTHFFKQVPTEHKTKVAEPITTADR